MSAEELLFANELGEEHDHLKGAFDVIMAGDCTVNVEIHDILIATVRQLLAPGGIFMYLAPRRGKSLGKFVKKARLESQFEVVPTQTTTKKSPQLTLGSRRFMAIGTTTKRTTLSL